MKHKENFLGINHFTKKISWNELIVVISITLLTITIKWSYSRWLDCPLKNLNTIGYLLFK